LDKTEVKNWGDLQGNDLWKQIRNLFTTDSNILFMDAGPRGSALRGCLDTDDAECSTTLADVRTAVGAGFGCDHDELVITQNTTDALCKIFGGLDLHEGDEILTTNHEHSGSRAPLAIARDRHGVVVRRITLPIGNNQCANDYVERFSACITRRTKVLMFSAPTYTTGTMLPVCRLALLAQQFDLISVVDAAHLPGMMHCDLHRFGVDFLAGSGNKWQGGPAGTGILYIRNKVLDRFNPRPLPRFWPIISIWYPCDGGLPPRTTTDTPSYDIAEYLQTMGSISVSRMQAFRNACGLWDQIGRHRIEQHLLDLSAYLKQRILEHWGEAALYSPWSDDCLTTAITSFTPFRETDDRFVEQKFREFIVRLMTKYRIVAKYIEFEVPGAAAPAFAVRICTRLTHLREDVDRLVDAMREISDSMA
jgi:isopenicillin-N epimerase